MLRAGVRNVRAAGRKQRRPLAGTAEELPFRDASFDAVSFSYLLGYVDDPEATLAEMARWLRPGGTVARLASSCPRRTRHAVPAAVKRAVPCNAV
jgi:demethylmenaquinone methyltransferase/2-methoxy-6-polyprenyl-1,4-benzoquinol methylase